MIEDNIVPRPANWTIQSHEGLSSLQTHNNNHDGLTTL